MSTLIILFSSHLLLLQGLSLTRKCPKGNSCGYLHLFRNPRNLFNANLESQGTPASARVGNKTPVVRTPK